MFFYDVDVSTREIEAERINVIKKHKKTQNISSQARRQLCSTPSKKEIFDFYSKKPIPPAILSTFLHLVKNACRNRL
ncbi:MAG: hypothetical protein L6V93_11765 [Clostridiales bacterium]|nr:MAG: hypothetical protein L6V93_11765 [Clostridiales bacterium]